MTWVKSLNKVVKVQDSPGKLEWTYQRPLGILSSLKDQFEVRDHEFVILASSSVCCSDKCKQSRCMVGTIYSWGLAKRKIKKRGIGEFKTFTNKRIMCNVSWTENRGCALTGVAQWVGWRPVDQKVAVSVPGHHTCLGCRPGPGGNQSMFLSLSCSLPSPLSKSK